MIGSMHEAILCQMNRDSRFVCFDLKTLCKDSFSYFPVFSSIRKN